MGKIPNKLAPPLDNSDYFEFWEKLIFDTPSTEDGKNLKCLHFGYRCTPLTLAKAVPKLNLTDFWGLFHSYIGHKLYQMLQLSHRCFTYI